MDGKSYSIEMSNIRSDYTIYYTEKENSRELAIAMDLTYKFFLVPVATIYLRSFTCWESSKQNLSVDEYSLVLKRVYDYLRKLRYFVRFSIDDNPFVSDPDQIEEMLKDSESTFTRLS